MPERERARPTLTAGRASTWTAEGTAHPACYLRPRLLVEARDGNPTTSRQEEMRTMYTFAVTVLLGLAVLTVVDVLADLVPGLSHRRSVVTIALAVVGAFALDYSLFKGFGVALRETWMGTLLTGVVVAGITTAWRAVFGWFGTPEGEQSSARRAGRPLVSKAA